MFTFIDLFSGIGGFHLGCSKQGGQCLAACEIDAVAREIYDDNFRMQPHDDIHTLKPIQGADLVCAGFPCQSHSSLGRRLGMKDARGKLFEVLKTFIAQSQPKSFLLENVKGLISSNNNKSFKYVMQSLADIGYQVSWSVLDSRNFGLPQHRERVFIVGHKERTLDFEVLQKKRKLKLLRDMLDAHPSDGLDCHIFDNVDISDPAVPTDSGFLLRAKLNAYTNRKLFSTDGIIGTIATGSPPPIYDERIKKLGI